jgi:hypothetical protein
LKGGGDPPGAAGKFRELVLETVTSVVESSEDDRNAALLARYGTVRRFLPLLLKDVAFGGNEAGKAVLDALAFLRRQDAERPRPSWDDAPTAVVADSWLRIAGLGTCRAPRLHALRRGTTARGAAPPGRVRPREPALG